MAQLPGMVARGLEGRIGVRGAHGFGRERGANLRFRQVAASSRMCSGSGSSPQNFSANYEVSPELLRNLQWRASYLGRAYRYDPDPIDEIMEEDELSLR